MTWTSTLNPPRGKRRRQRPDITLLSRQHSAVLDQSRTSPLGGAIAPSLTDLARRAPQSSGSGRKNRLFRSNKRMDESEKSREMGLTVPRSYNPHSARGTTRPQTLNAGIGRCKPLRDNSPAGCVSATASIALSTLPSIRIWPSLRADSARTIGYFALWTQLVISRLWCLAV
jgi:hypothetical protein